MPQTPVGTPASAPRPATCDPDSLPIGARVAIVRPLYPSASNWAGRHGTVQRTSVHAPEGKRGRPAPTPRLAVWVSVIPDHASYPGQRTFKWADELDLIDGGTA